MTPISVCMIAKNEAVQLKKCLSLLRPHFAEIILADTGSTDDTAQVAAQYADKVLHFQWVNDFSAARNFSIAHASHHWILVVDCDEFLTQINLRDTQRQMQANPGGIGMIKRDNPYSDSSLGADAMMRERVARLFDRRIHHYQGSIHEQATPIDGSDAQYFHVPLTFYHEGYADKERAEKKAGRNLDMLLAALEKEGPDPYTYFQIGQSYRALGRADEACRYFDLGLSFDLDTQLEYVQTMVESYGHALLSAGRAAEALSFTGIYDAFATRADFVFLMGLIYMNNAQFDLAIAEFKKATTIKKYAATGVNGHSAYYNIGVIYECMGDRKNARAYYQKCGDFAPARARLALL